MNDDLALARQLTDKALSDFSFFCRKCFHIKTKDGEVKTLELNKAQRLLIEAANRQLSQGKPVRIIVLKARQMGMSTVIEAYLLWRMLRQGNVNALEIAHEKEAASYILGINKFAIDNLPAWFVTVLGIDPGLFNKNEVTFTHNNTSLYISSADSKEPGRSRTIHYLHLSEVAFYPPNTSLRRSGFGSLSDSPKSVVFMESTGNGPAGLFYNYYTAAKNGRNDYEPLFFAWFIHDEYKMAVPDGVKPFCPPRLYQLWLDGVISDEQLYWRQQTIANKFEGKEADFLAEYPEFEEDAWFQESANLFDTTAVYERMKNCPAFEEGRLIEDDEGISFESVRSGPLHVYKFPEPNKTYVIGADVGSGVVVNRIGDGSPADVLDVETGEQVAHLYLVCEPTQYAAELKLLGQYYKNAMIAPEVTGGHGLSVVNWLRDNGYYNLYQRRTLDKISQTFTYRLGWDTTKKTRPMMINKMRSDFRSGTLIVNEEATLREMLTFIKNGERYEAASGAKDDRVISLAIANMVRGDAVSYVPPPVEEEEPEPVNPRIQFVQNALKQRREFDF